MTVRAPTPIRLGHLPDLHLGLYGRAKQVERSLQLQLVDLHAVRPDVVLQTGDVMDSLSGIHDRNLFSWFAAEVAAIAPFYIIPGNHDRPGDTRIFGYIPGVTVFERPATEIVLDGRLLLMALPHLAKGALVTEGDIEQSNRGSEARIREILADFRCQRESFRGPAVLMCHLDIHGRALSNGETRLGQGIAASVPNLLASGADYVAAGHVHLYQELDPRVAYAGSAARCNFGEPDDKGWLLVAVGGRGDLPKIERRAIPCRPMFTIARTFDEGTGAWSQTEGPEEAELPADSELKVRLVCPETRMAELALERTAVLGRWADAKIEPKTTGRAAVRSEAIGAAQTEAEMLQMYWVHEGVETPSKAFQDRALAALAEALEEIPT